MYCHKCGVVITNDEKYCHNCGTLLKRDVAKVVEKEVKNKTKKEDKYKHLKNKFLIPAVLFSFLSFLLAIFPYPHSWGIGTSFWMRVTILLLAAIGRFLCQKAKEINLDYQKKYAHQVKPVLLKWAIYLSTITLIISLLSNIMIQFYSYTG